MWRSPELETALGAPLDAASLAEANLQRLIDLGIRESEQLDYKQFGAYSATGPGARPGWTKEQEFAKDVAAFANLRGGLLVIGLKEVDEVPVELLPNATDDPVALEQRLRAALVNNVAPSVQVGFITVPAAVGGFYVALVVPPSGRAPHCVLGHPGDGRAPLHYPVRDGAGARWLSEAEVAARYAGRLAAGVEGAAREARAVSEGCDQLRRGEGLWLYTCVVPETVAPGPLTAATVSDADEWYGLSPLTSPLGRQVVPRSARAIAGPARATFTWSSGDPYDQTDPRLGYVELHVGGAAFAATSISQNTSSDPRRSAVVGDVTVVDDMIVLVDLCLQWAARQVGAWGSAMVLTGLCDAGTGAERALSTPVELVGNDTPHSDNLRRLPRTRTLTRAPQARVTADLADATTTQSRLAVTYHALAGLLQFFGKAEPDLLSPSGEFVTHAWPVSYVRQVEAWATQHAVEWTG